jgi:hypothetical protein
VSTKNIITPLELLFGSGDLTSSLHDHSSNNNNEFNKIWIILKKTLSIINIEI